MDNYSSSITADQIINDLRYLRQLGKSFPTIAAASTEIINLEAILNLPKGTEHFISDLHGEYEAFLHVLKNASGNIKRKVNEIFGTSMREVEQKELCTLIYYPQEKLEIVKDSENDLSDWYMITLHQLVRVCQNVSTKYTRSKVRRALPDDYSYIIQELLHESNIEKNKQEYLNRIITTIIEIGRADDFIIELCHLIQRLAIDQLHIVGDIFDRGPGAHIIMEALRHYHHFDIQWGNHDISWIGAASGNQACIANVLRISFRYGNMQTLEDGYGINLLPLATFALETYGDDPCERFLPLIGNQRIDEKTNRLLAMMHKAIAVMQFKIEAQIIDRHPEFDMADRKLLHYIDQKKGKFVFNGTEYDMYDSHFPTIDPEHPYELTPTEQDILNKLCHSFKASDKLKKHIKCLFQRGGMYTVCNGNLLFHASIPLTKDGQLKEVCVNGKMLKGKALMDGVDYQVRTAFNAEARSEARLYAKDFLWYLWCGKDSPLYDKDKMTTFENYFLKDKSLTKEEKGFYYTFRNEEKVCDMILDDFQVVGEHRHIINGHVPVRAGTKGESPIKANGKMIVIDGGFAKAYHEKTGIAGYTLVYHSRGLQLVQHEPFESARDAIERGTDIASTILLVELSSHRVLVQDTDLGRELELQIQDLKKLLFAYRNGFIKEREK
ncbi:MAG: fructose-1,6-bisphosphatase, partial [Bacteroidaceae bacterium]|nr:fructose-1,6-bisphosphatase [Bacteroidaceae bacterium]